MVVAKDCPICYDALALHPCTKCANCICEGCYVKIRESHLLKSQCPLCRTPYVEEDLNQDYTYTEMGSIHSFSEWEEGEEEEEEGYSLRSSYDTDSDVEEMEEMEEIYCSPEEFSTSSFIFSSIS